MTISVAMTIWVTIYNNDEVRRHWLCHQDRWSFLKSGDLVFDSPVQNTDAYNEDTVIKT